MFYFLGDSRGICIIANNSFMENKLRKDDFNPLTANVPHHLETSQLTCSTSFIQYMHFSIYICISKCNFP